MTRFDGKRGLASKQDVVRLQTNFRLCSLETYGMIVYDVESTVLCVRRNCILLIFYLSKIPKISLNKLRTKWVAASFWFNKAPCEHVCRNEVSNRGRLV